MKSILKLIFLLLLMLPVMTFAADYDADKKIDELLEIGGTQILFQGGVHPKLKIDFYEDLVEHISSKYPCSGI